MAVVYQNGAVELNEVRRIFGNPDDSKLSTQAPTSAQNGEVYVYRVTENMFNREWLDDGLNWKIVRNKHLPKVKPEFVVATSQLKSGSNTVDFHRKEYATEGSKHGQLESYGRRLVVVTYYGKFDPSQAVSTLPHGNTKKTPQKAKHKLKLELAGESPLHGTPSGLNTSNVREVKRRLDYLGSEVQEDCLSSPDVSHESSVQGSEKGFVSTSYGTRNLMKQKLTMGMSPTNAYRETVASIASVSGMTSPHLPRNPKQAQNFQCAKEKTELESVDDVYAAYAFHKEYPSIMPDYILGPSLAFTITNPNIVQHVKSLLRGNGYLVLHYDTTFSIGRFYVSALVFRHFLFKDEPIIPLCLLVHEVGSERYAHDYLFKRISDLIPQLNSDKVVLVTDREDAISNSIKNNLPSLNLHYCWNHMRRNVGDWAQKHFGIEVAAVYKEQYLKLLQSESLDTYNERLSTFSETWEIGFLEYYKTHQERDVKDNGIFRVSRYGIADADTGITNNPSESFNRALKRTMPTPNASFETILHSTYVLLCTFSLDIFRGLTKSGPYEMKREILAESTQSLIEEFDTEADENIGGIENIADFVQNGKIRVPVTAAVHKSERPRTTVGWARWFVKNERLTWLPERKCFTCTGLRNKTFVVDVKAMSCSCVSEGSCSHLIAVLMGTNLYNPTSKLPRRKFGNLGALYKRTSKTRTGKKGNPRLRVPKCLADIQDTSEIEQVEVNNPETSAPTKRRFTFKKKVTTVTEKDFSQTFMPESVKVSEITIEDFCSKLPSVTKTNATIKVINECYGGGSVLLADLATLKTKLTRSEIAAINANLAEIGYVREEKASDMNTGYLSDRIILEFASIVKTDSDIIIKPWESKFYLDMSEMTVEPESLSNLDFRAVQRVFLIHHCMQNSLQHWILICISKEIAEIQIFDPTGVFKLDLSSTNFRATLLPRMNSTSEWTIKYPQIPLMDNSRDCGVYLCYYLKALCEGDMLTTELDSDAYRNIILKTISQDCNVWDIPPKSKICYTCKKKPNSKEQSDLWIQCKRCGKWEHVACLRGPIKGDKIDYVCVA